MPTTNTTAKTPDTYTTTLSDLSTSASRPDDRSGGLDLLVDAAYAAREAYDEIDWQHDHAADGSDVKALLRRARETAYDTWQAIERAGLPLLQRWQRETLGYDEDEITQA